VVRLDDDFDQREAEWITYVMSALVDLIHAVPGSFASAEPSSLRRVFGPGGWDAAWRRSKPQESSACRFDRFREAGASAPAAAATCPAER
jgi:hypothetical protein